MTADLDPYNLNELCRLCLKCEGTILPIFGLEHSSKDCIPLSNKIKACVAVEVNKDDDLPKKICVGCVAQVDSWHKFKTICDSSQSKLLSWVKPPSTSNRTQHNQVTIKQEPEEIIDDDVICCDEIVDDYASIQPMQPFRGTVSAGQPIAPPAEVVVLVDDNEEEEEDDDEDEGLNIVGNDDNRSLHVEDLMEIEHSVDNVDDDDISFDVGSNNVDDDDEDDDDEDEDDDVVECIDEDDDVSSSSISIKDATGSQKYKGQNVHSRQDPKNLAGAHSSKAQEQPARKEKDLEKQRVVNGVSSDDLMLADFSDELAPDVKLSVVAECSVIGEAETSQDDAQNEHDDKMDVSGEASIKVLMDESNTIINRIHSEIGRRLSTEDDIEMVNGISSDNNSVSGRSVVSVISSENVDKSKRAANISSSKTAGATPLRMLENMVSESPDATTVSDSGLLIVEGFTLTEEYQHTDRNFIQDTIQEHNKMRNLDAVANGLRSRSESARPDLELVETVKSRNAHSGEITVFNIKQEPQSPHMQNAELEEVAIKKEPYDWSLLDPEPIDIKPDISHLEMSKRYHYPNGIPCEPCKASFPNYIKWLRHTKSHKHQRNIMSFDNMSPFLHGNSQSTLDIFKYKASTDFPCPLSNCERGFKYRRNLNTHVKNFHGCRLKDYEKIRPTMGPPAPAQVAAPIESVPYGATPVQEEKTMFCCTHCSKKFSYRQSLRNHLFIFHNVTPASPKLKCPRCFKNFQKTTGLKSHMRTCGVFLKSKRCPYCEEVFPTYKDNAKHKGSCPKRYAPKGMVEKKPAPTGTAEYGTYSCSFCNITFQIHSVYTSHMDMYHAGEPYDENGENNDELLSEAPELNGEAKTDDGDDQADVVKYSCTFCTDSFPSTKELAIHESFHQRDSSFHCKLCNQVLSCFRYFQDHMRSHFIKHRGQYLCWTCYKPFNNRSDLNAHKKLHIKMKIYSCNVCKHSFSSPVSLRNHKRHHDKVSYVPVNDSEKTVDDKVIEEEEEEDDDEVLDEVEDVVDEVDVLKIEDVVSEFQCHVCKKSFSSKDALDKHSRLHNPVKMEVIKKLVQKCEHCKLTFKTRSALRVHAQFCRKDPSTPDDGSNEGSASGQNDMTQQKDKKVQCDKCGAWFSKMVNLRKHITLNRCPLVRQQNEYDRTRFPCKYCRKVCGNLMGLYRHLSTCKVVKNKLGRNVTESKKCEHCNKAFSSLGVLYNHKKFCTATNVIKSDPQDQATEDAPPTVTTTKKNYCSGCNQEFYSFESYQRHLKYCKTDSDPTASGQRNESDTGERKFKRNCPHCDKSFSNVLSYKLHKKFCSSEVVATPGSFKCDGCSRSFITDERLKVHLKVCRFFRQTPVVMLTKQAIIDQCPCGRVFSTKSMLDAHKAVCHQAYEDAGAAGSTSTLPANQSNLDCEYCHRHFLKYQSRNSHLRVCKAKLNYMSKKRKDALKLAPPPTMPSSSSSLQPDYSCTMCKVSFLTEEEFIAHNCQDDIDLSNSIEITVEPDNPLENYDDDIMYEEEVVQRPPKKSQKCIPCNKVFSCVSSLNKHKSVFHNSPTGMLIRSDGTVQCPKCPRSFKDHKSMTHHMGWHTRHEESSMQQQHQQQLSIANHMLATPPAPVMAMPAEVATPSQFRCNVCDRTFAGEGQLMNHVKVHGQSPAAYSASATVTNSGAIDLTYGQTKADNASSSLRCKFCPKKFKDKTALVAHHNLHKSIIASSTNLKAKMLEQTGKYYVSCNLCNKVLSSNSVAKHKKMHEIKENMPLSMSEVFSPVTSRSLKMPSPQQPQQASPQQQAPQQQFMLPCSICFRLFGSQNSLSNHMKTDHAPKAEPYANDENDDDDVLEDEQGTPGGTYKCEICNKNWQHRSAYLRHVNAVSHRELTKRLSAILNRVNNDVAKS